MLWWQDPGQALALGGGPLEAILRELKATLVPKWPQQLDTDLRHPRHAPQGQRGLPVSAQAGRVGRCQGFERVGRPHSWGKATQLSTEAPATRGAGGCLRGRGHSQL